MNNYIKPPVLSTKFSDKGSSAKKRFENILNSQVRKRGAIAIVFILILLSIIGTAVACGNERNDKLFEYGSLHDLMGQNKVTVIDKLMIDDSEATIEKQGDEEMYSFQTNVNNKPCVVSIIFYNDILMGYQYRFEDTNNTYEYAVDLRKYLETAYGEPGTQPILSPDRKNFDSLDSYDDIEFSDIRMVYYEDWNLEKDPELEKEMLGDLEIERLDITMQLISTPTNHVILITRYFAVRTSLQ